jgi:hypothetical protein
LLRVLDCNLQASTFRATNERKRACLFVYAKKSERWES